MPVVVFKHSELTLKQDELVFGRTAAKLTVNIMLGLQAPALSGSVRGDSVRRKSQIVLMLPGWVIMRTMIGV